MWHNKERDTHALSLYGSWGIRDCSHFASIEVSADTTRHANAHIKAFTKLRNSLDEMIEELETCKKEAIEKGYWKDE